MAQSPLSDLNVLCIKNETTRSLDVNTLVEKFVEKNKIKSQKFE